MDRAGTLGRGFTNGGGGLANDGGPEKTGGEVSEVTGKAGGPGGLAKGDGGGLASVAGVSEEGRAAPSLALNFPIILAGILPGGFFPGKTGGRGFALGSMSGDLAVGSPGCLNFGWNGGGGLKEGLTGAEFAESSSPELAGAGGLALGPMGSLNLGWNGGGGFGLKKPELEGELFPEPGPELSSTEFSNLGLGSGSLNLAVKGGGGLREGLISNPEPEPAPEPELDLATEVGLGTEAGVSSPELERLAFGSTGSLNLAVNGGGLRVAGLLGAEPELVVAGSSSLGDFGLGCDFGGNGGLPELGERESGDEDCSDEVGLALFGMEMGGVNAGLSVDGSSTCGGIGVGNRGRDPAAATASDAKILACCCSCAWICNWSWICWICNCDIRFGLTTGASPRVGGEHSSQIHGMMIL